MAAIPQDPLLLAVQNADAFFHAYNIQPNLILTAHDQGQIVTQLRAANTPFIGATAAAQKARIDTLLNVHGLLTKSQTFRFCVTFLYLENLCALYDMADAEIFGPGGQAAWPIHGVQPPFTRRDNINGVFVPEYWKFFRSKGWVLFNQHVILRAVMGNGPPRKSEGRYMFARLRNEYSQPPKCQTVDNIVKSWRRNRNDIINAMTNAGGSITWLYQTHVRDLGYAQRKGGVGKCLKKAKEIVASVKCMNEKGTGNINAVSPQVIALQNVIINAARNALANNPAVNGIDDEGIIQAFNKARSKTLDSE